MSIEQSAGRFLITVYPEGHPLQGAIKYERYGRADDVEKIGIFGEEDLHDLRYAIDRVLAILADRHPATMRISR